MLPLRLEYSHNRQSRHPPLDNPGTNPKIHGPMSSSMHLLLNQTVFALWVQICQSLCHRDKDTGFQPVKPDDEKLCKIFSNGARPEVDPEVLHRLLAVVQSLKP